MDEVDGLEKRIDSLGENYRDTRRSRFSAFWMGWVGGGLSADAAFMHNWPLALTAFACLGLGIWVCLTK